MPNVKHLRVFGSKCWYVLPKQKVHKLDKRSNIGIFVGYSVRSKAYKIIDAESGNVIISRDVIFDENSSVEKYSSQSWRTNQKNGDGDLVSFCLLYTSDAADD